MTGTTFTFLGTGTSQGVPMLACECVVCRSEDPRDRRTRSSVYVEGPEGAFVIDTGADFRSQCLREGVKRVDAVVYTHAHADHVMGFDDLRPFCRPGEMLPVYASAPTMADLQVTFRFAFNGENRYPTYIHPDPRIIEGPFHLGGLELVPVPLPHGRVTVFGYVLRRGGEALVAYLSDCKEVPESVTPLLAGVRHLVVDALRHRPHPTHMSVEEALAVVARVRPQQAWFTHLCHELGHGETEAALPPGVRIAYDGLKLEL